MPKPVLQRRFTTQIPPHSLPSPSNIPPPDGGESVTTEFDGENSLKPVAILRKLRFATSFLSINPSNLLFRSYELQTRVRWVYQTLLQVSFWVIIFRFFL